MSIDLSWEALTSGPEGEALAERIRCFIHDKFQTAPLPRFIRSVSVHGFDFGSIPPALELKDVTDPLTDFYELELDDDGGCSGDSDSDEGDADESGHGHLAAELGLRGAQAAAVAGREKRPDRPAGLTPATVLRNEVASIDMGGLFLGTSTPGILGGLGRNYFPGHLGTGTQTPLAAVAGAHLVHGGWMAGSSSATIAPPLAYHGHGRQHRRGPQSRQPSQSSTSVTSVDNQVPSPRRALYPPPLREKSSVSTLAATSTSASRPPTRDAHPTAHDGAAMTADPATDADTTTSPPPQLPVLSSRREPRVEDVQAVFRIRYSGDVRLNLTAEILLDYPMPSFVSIPIKLSITGLSFDGVGVLAHIRKRLHFCFLSPEDAIMAVGPDDATDADGHLTAAPVSSSSAWPQKRRGKFAGLLQEIKVESEIGERDGGKQSLKNVGKVEKFVLEQVRRIFNEEFVYPSFWTFLV